MKKLAEIISLILNPVFLIVLLILLGIEKSDLSQANLMIFTVFAMVLNGLLPAYFILHLAKKGMILDDILDNKEVLKNRPFILAWGTIILLLELLTLYFFEKPQPLFAILTVLLLLTLALFLITLYRKISLHLSFMTIFATVVLLLFGYSFWPVLILIPLVFWSRLILKRHTKRQLLAGIVVALLIFFCVFYYFNFLP